MGKLTVLLLSLLLLQACSHIGAEPSKADKESRYFADATECYQTAHIAKKRSMLRYRAIRNIASLFLSPSIFQSAMMPELLRIA